MACIIIRFTMPLSYIQYPNAILACTMHTSQLYVLCRVLQQKQIAANNLPPKLYCLKICCFFFFLQQFEKSNRSKRNCKADLAHATCYTKQECSTNSNAIQATASLLQEANHQAACKHSCNEHKASSLCTILERKVNKIFTYFRGTSVTGTIGVTTYAQLSTCWFPLNQKVQCLLKGQCTLKLTCLKNYTLRSNKARNREKI